MKIINNCKRWFVGVVIVTMSVACFCAEQDTTDSLFLKSFIDHYEVNPEGRYTHEYHPFLLDQTQRSFYELEQRLHDENFAMHGRIIIMGYEEQAVPQYYTNFLNTRINDEAIRKNHAGWSLRLHNRFGFMTGFLFKELPYIPDVYFPEHVRVFEHVDAQTIPLFDDRAYLFQQHAFGQALPVMSKEMEVVLKKLHIMKPRDILCELERFWQVLYHNAFKVGNNQIAGTQDVLFSIEYAKYLAGSQLPLYKFFIGPDITYPIEITAKQEKAVTLHAQRFVKTLSQHLVARHDRSTAYIFCSFVDGVGKSTMLGNLKNWMNFGQDIEHFQHVDNSSSQWCELFKFKENVFIVDLPAQVSHFTYKPDGYVFVDIRTADASDLIKELEVYVTNNRVNLKQNYQRLCEQVATLIATKGFAASELNDSQNPAYAFIKNVILLKRRESNTWIPFEYQGKSYLFKDGKPLEIRFFTALSSVKSEGLKNIESEQMLFFDGIRFPAPYGIFLDNLVLKLKENNIKNIVFVDFLSMYPRSSRENVRINYLLQQMALLDTNFNPYFSLYRDFVSGGELLYALLHKTSRQILEHSFELETLVRLALFRMLVQQKQADLGACNIASLTDALQLHVQSLYQQHGASVATLAEQKIDRETTSLEALYGLSKHFVNIQQFSFEKVHALSSLLQQFFTDNVTHEGVNEMWQNPGMFAIDLKEHVDGKRQNVIEMTNSHVPFRQCYAFHTGCRDELLLTPFVRSLRTCWYASLLNLLACTAQGSHQFELQRALFNVVPLMLVKGSDGLYYTIQRFYEPWSQKIKKNVRTTYRMLGLSMSKPRSFVTVNETPYRFDWNNKTSNSGLLGFDCSLKKDDISHSKSQLNKATVSAVVQDYQAEHGASCVMPTSLLWNELNQHSGWFKKLSMNRKKAQNKGVYQGPPSLQEKAKKKSFWSLSKKLYLGNQSHIPIARMLIRLLATLEMVLKDPDADIVIRDGNREDFKAALKLFEHVVLPGHCNIIFLEDVFSDYDSVEPYPSWDFWDNLEV